MRGHYGGSGMNDGFVTYENVSKIYRMGEVSIRAVDHISFSINKG